MNNYIPLTQEQMTTLMPLFMANASKRELPFEGFKRDMIGDGKNPPMDGISAILLKRIEGFKLPHFEVSAIIMLSVLSKGNPGKAILGLIEVLEKNDEHKPEKIDIGFISEHVFPFGFFSEEYAEKLYDEKRYDNPKKYKYSKIFC